MPPALKYEKVPTRTEREDDEDDDDRNGDLGIVNRTLEVAANYDRSINRVSEAATVAVAAENNIMAIANLPSTNSSQQLMGGDSESVTASIAGSSTMDGRGASNASLDTIKRPSSRTSHQYDGFSSITLQEWFTVGVLCFVNLINYMDRFTIAGKWDLSFFVGHFTIYIFHFNVSTAFVFYFYYGWADRQRRHWSRWQTQYLCFLPCFACLTLRRYVFRFIFDNISTAIFLLLPGDCRGSRCSEKWCHACNVDN